MAQFYTPFDTGAAGRIINAYESRERAGLAEQEMQRRIADDAMQNKARQMQIQKYLADEQERAAKQKQLADLATQYQGVSMTQQAPNPQRLPMDMTPEFAGNLQQFLQQEAAALPQFGAYTGPTAGQPMMTEQPRPEMDIWKERGRLISQAILGGAQVDPNVVKMHEANRPPQPVTGLPTGYSVVTMPDGSYKLVEPQKPDNQILTNALGQIVSVPKSNPKNMTVIDPTKRPEKPIVINNGMPQGKAPAGYRYTADGNLEAIPGGPAAQKQAQMARSMDDSKAAIDLSISTIDKLIAHPGRSQATGKSRMLGVQNVPGTDAYGFDRELESFDAQLFLSNIGSMKGMGALSNAEGAKVSAAAGAIKPGMKDTALLTNLETIKTALNKAKQRIDTGKLVNPDGTPQQAPASTQQPAARPKAGDIVKGYRFKGGNPADKNNWVKQ